MAGCCPSGTPERLAQSPQRPDATLKSNRDANRIRAPGAIFLRQDASVWVASAISCVARYLGRSAA